MSSFAFPEPSFRQNILETVLNLVPFATKTLLQKHRSFGTAEDTDEKLNLIAQMMLTSASMSLLSIAYLSENDDVLEQARVLLRDIAQ